MKKITSSIIVSLISIQLFSQIGGAGNCVTSGNPNTKVEIQSQDKRYDCLRCLDTLNNDWYFFESKNNEGSRWVKEGSDEPLLFGFNNINGKIENDTVFNFMILGDSKTEGSDRGSLQLRNSLYERYGFAGVGYASFSYIPPLGMVYTNNNCDIIDNQSKGLSYYHCELNDAGDYFEMRATTARFNESDQVTLYYLEQPTGGVIDIIYAGSTTQVNTSGASGEKKKIVLTGSYGKNDLRINRVSGSSIIYEAVFKNTEATSGVVFHRVGNGGTTYGAFKTVFDNFENGDFISDHEIDHCMIRFGTNDWSANVPPSTVYSNMESITDSIRANRLTCGISIIGQEDVILAPNRSYTREEYETVQERICATKGFTFIPLFPIISDWSVWDANGNADDDVHSSRQGGDIIGKYLFEAFLGNNVFLARKSIDGNHTPQAIVYTDTNGNEKSDSSRIYYNEVDEHIGIRTTNPQYALDMPHDFYNDWRLGALSYDQQNGLIFDNTGGFQGDVLFDLSGSRQFDINLSGGASSFNVNGLTNINLGDYFSINVGGAFLYDNTSAEGDVVWNVDGSNDYKINLAGGGNSDFIVNWAGTDVFTVNWNNVEIHSPLQLRNTSSTSTNWANGLLFRDSSSDYVAQASWEEVSNQIIANELNSTITGANHISNNNNIQSALLELDAAINSGGSDNWGTQTAETDNTLLGDGSTGNELKVDTSIIATKEDINLEENGIVYTDNLGNITSENSNLFFKSDSIGLLTNNPSYHLDMPPSPVNSWRLTGLSQTAAGGLLFDNTLGTGLEGDVIFNVNGNNDVIYNLTGGSAEFKVNGTVNVDLTDYFSINAGGSFTYDNSLAEGDINWVVDANNDYNINLAGGSGADFVVQWAGTDRFIVNWNDVEIPSPLKLGNVNTTSTNWSNGLLFKDSVNEYVREATWSEVSQQLIASQIATTITGATHITDNVSVQTALTDLDAAISSGSGDDWGSQAVVSDATITGVGITGDSLRIAQQGATLDQVLAWDGNTWKPRQDSTIEYTSDKTINISTGNVISNEWTMFTGINGNQGDAIIDTSSQSVTNLYVLQSTPEDGKIQVISNLSTNPNHVSRLDYSAMNVPIDGKTEDFDVNYGETYIFQNSNRGEGWRILAYYNANARVLEGDGTTTEIDGDTIRSLWNMPIGNNSTSFALVDTFSGSGNYITGLGNPIDGRFKLVSNKSTNPVHETRLTYSTSTIDGKAENFFVKAGQTFLFQYIERTDDWNIVASDDTGYSNNNLGEIATISTWGFEKPLLIDQQTTTNTYTLPATWEGREGDVITFINKTAVTKTINGDIDGTAASSETLVSGQSIQFIWGESNATWWKL